MSPGTWDVDTALAYQWFADGAAIDGATGLTYDLTPAEHGKAITFAVTSTKATYETVTRTSGPTSAVSAGDLVLTPVPTITGTPAVAGTLTAHPGTWDDGVTFGYQWTVDGTDVGGATSPTYSPVVGDLGKVVTVKVTGSKDGYINVTKESDATAAVASGELSSTPTPTITGTPKVAQQLTAVPGTWDSGVTLAYQWTADGTDIPGATAVTYTVSVGDLGKAIAVKVTGSKTGYTSVTRTSPSSSDIEAGDLVLTPVPTITGTPQVGQLLTAVPGTWDDGVDLTYQWTADGTDIAGRHHLGVHPGRG